MSRRLPISCRLLRAFPSIAHRRRVAAPSQLRERAQDAHHRAGRGGERGGQGYPPLPFPAQRPAPSRRFVHLPGPHGHGQDRAGEDPRRIPVGSKDALISFDMSEFASEYEVSKLIGSPRVMWATRKAASSPRPFAVTRIRWCSSTRSKRRIRTSSISCCKCSMRGV